MKKFIALISVAFIFGCQLDDNITAPLNTMIGLGVPSAQLTVSNVSGPETTGIYTVTVNVTPGAKYSFALTHIDGTVLNNYGFTAEASQMTIDLDYTDIANGAYDLNLMDNVGRMLKLPVIIQH